MNRLIFLISVVFFFECSAQIDNQQQDFVLDILQDEIILSEDSITMKVSIKNNTDTTYLLYAFRFFGEAIGDEGFYTKDDNITSSTDLFIFQENGRQIFPENFDITPPKEIDHKPISLDTLERSLRRTGEAYAEKMLLLPAKSEKLEKLSLRIKYHDLRNGIYNCFIIYYSGKNLYNLVSKEQVLEDEKNFDAIEFRGWIKSDTVKLIVNK